MSHNSAPNAADRPCAHHDAPPPQMGPGWENVDTEITRKAIQGGRDVGSGLGLGLIDDLGLSPDDGWEIEHRAYPIPACASSTEDQARLDYMRALPERCRFVAVNHRTQQVIPLLTPEAGRLLCLALDTEGSRDFVAYMDEKEEVRTERAALLREMNANASRLVKRRQIPTHVYESIRNVCQEGLDAKRRRDTSAP
ncbi:hypothetical protein pmac_cds_896 [Pandoravirus macleodensis]|uniref:Uncharacterized protein n=1 Tax=Pandoravirus macleodensis TaxID=2107707 RepID=A0A2U7UGI0_9VIRU|nr:hypothetical protein pmac_cds_896 [Pandoravirus macleodensis]AVK77584.1 hypothetical protein pmac_cds_896 [Pandoravirus macleodensis]